MASPAEEAARKQRKEEEAEIRRLKELGITQADLTEEQDAEIQAEGLEKATRKRDREIAESSISTPGEQEYRGEKPEEGLLLRNPNDQFGGTSGGTTGADIRTQPKEEEIQEKVKGSEALGKISYGEDQTTYEEGEQVEGAVPGETEEERVRKLAEYNSPEQVKARKKEDKKLLAGVEERIATAEAEGQKDVQRQTDEYAQGLDEKSHDPSSLLYRSPEYRRDVDKAQGQLDFLDRRDAGESRVQQTTADSPVLQEHFEKKEAKRLQAIQEKKEFETMSGDTLANVKRSNEELEAKNEVLKEAGITPTSVPAPIFYTPHGAKGGEVYDPAKKRLLVVKGDDGKTTRHMFVPVEGYEDPDKPSPEEMKTRREEYAAENKIRDAAIKKDRVRRGYLKTGDVHGLTELDRQTEEDAATRLRDAEAAIRADETKSQTEKEIAIQELKNKGTLDVTESEVGGRSDVEKKRGKTARKVSAQTIEGAAASQESLQAHQVTTAENLATTQTATADAQAEVDKAAAAVENEQDLRMQAEKQEHLNAMQDNLIEAQAAEGAAQREADKARDDADRAAGTSAQEREIAEREREQESRQEAAAREGEAQGERDLDILDASRNTPEAVAARRRARQEEAMADMAINQAILDDDTSSPEQKSKAQAAIDAAKQTLTSPDEEAGAVEVGPIPEGTPVSESEDYLEANDPLAYGHVEGFSVFVNDNDGDETTNWLLGNNTDAFIDLVADIREKIRTHRIDPKMLPYIGHILLSKMHPEMRKSYDRLVRVRNGDEPRFRPTTGTAAGIENRHNEADDSIRYLEQIFAGTLPDNPDSFVPSEAAVSNPDQGLHMTDFVN